MSKYSTILKSEGLGRVQRWFIFGPNKPFVQDAYELALSHVESSDFFEISKNIFFGSEDISFNLERCLIEDHIYEDRGIVVLFEADKYRNWPSLLKILKNLPKNKFFIAVADGEVDKNSEIAQFFKRMSKTTKFVECLDTKGEDLIFWLETRLYISKSASRFLIKRSNGDYEWLLNTVKKLQQVDGFISLSLVEKICKYSYGHLNLEECIISGDKRKSLLSVSERELIDFNLPGIIDIMRKAYLINESVRSIGFFGARLLKEKSGLNPREIDQIRPHLKNFDRTSMLRRFSDFLKKRDLLTSGNKWAIESTIVKW